MEHFHFCLGATSGLAMGRRRAQRDGGRPDRRETRSRLGTANRGLSGCGVRSHPRPGCRMAGVHPSRPNAPQPAISGNIASGPGGSSTYDPTAQNLTSQISGGGSSVMIANDTLPSGFCVAALCLNPAIGPVVTWGGKASMGATLGATFGLKNFKWLCCVVLWQLFCSCTTKLARNRLKGPQARCRGPFSLSVLPVRTFQVRFRRTRQNFPFGAKKRHLRADRSRSSGRVRHVCVCTETNLAHCFAQCVVASRWGTLSLPTQRWCRARSGCLTVGVAQKRRDFPLLSSGCRRELAQSVTYQLASTWECGRGYAFCCARGG